MGEEDGGLTATSTDMKPVGSPYINLDREMLRVLKRLQDYPAVLEQSRWVDRPTIQIRVSWRDRMFEALGVVPKPHPVVLGPEDEELAELEAQEVLRLRASLGMASMPLPNTKTVHQKFLKFLHDRHMGTYKLHEVEAFLERAAKVETKAAIREKRIQNYETIHHTWVNYREYKKPVPVHVLSFMEATKKEFGTDVVFEISDYRAVSPDPFLIASIGGVNLVVMHWDEPGFKGKATKA